MSAPISVVIPAYNRAGLIGETLRSLLNQTVPAKEVIVVDDGSTDFTAEAVESEFTGFCRQFSGKGTLPDLKVIRQENAGPGAARNRGFVESTGEFIHFFDSDDIAAPNKQEMQLRALMESGADIAYGPWVKGRFAPAKARTVAGDGLKVTSEENTVMSDQLHATRDSWFEPAGPVLQARGLPKEDLVRALLTHWSIVPHACLFRRSIVERSGGFPPDMTGAEDQMMFLRCLLAGAKVVHTPGTIEFYRLGDAGKLTAQGEAQRRMALHWAEYLVRANEEVTSDEWRVTRGGEILTTDDTDGHRYDLERVDRISEHEARHTRTVTATPSVWFGFRLRAYEAWKDLEKFFSGEQEELKESLKQIYLQKLKHGKCEPEPAAKTGLSQKLKYEAVGWWVRKVGGVKKRLVGYREHGVFCCERYSPAALKL